MPHLPTTPHFWIRFAFVVSLILAVIKAIIGFMSGSLAILGSALDSFMDMFVSGVNAVALKLSERAGNHTYAYGLGKVQGFAAIFEWVVVLGSGIFLTYHGVINFLYHRTPEITFLEIITMVVAIVWTGLIMWNFLRISRVNDSLLIRSDALHYSSDLFMNGGILIALIIGKYFGLWWADAVFAVGIGLWIIRNALPIIWSGATMLLDRSLSREEVKIIEDFIREEGEVEDFHYLKTRTSGDAIFIEAHIVFRDKGILLKHAHDISEMIESRIMATFPGAIVTLHLDVDSEPELCDIRTKTCN
jgi:ferrous-iron efflux pump FieF